MTAITNNAKTTLDWSPSSSMLAGKPKWAPPGIPKNRMDSIGTEKHNIIPVNIPNSIYLDETLLFDVFPLSENPPFKT
jgi:hypothetical protein